jgi:hypothetical protein
MYGMFMGRIFIGKSAHQNKRDQSNCASYPENKNRMQSTGGFTLGKPVCPAPEYVKHDPLPLHAHALWGAFLY